jgi:Bacterial SH3 domain
LLLSDRRGRAAFDSLRRLFAPAALVLIFAACASGALAQTQTPTQIQTPAGASRITTAASVRLRATPDTASGEVARLQLGSVVRELERSQARSKVGASEDFWYMVSAADGARGWVFGGLTAPFDPARRDETYLRLSSDRLAAASPTFNDSVELVRFVERALKEVTRRGPRAELELARLRALARSLSAIPVVEQTDAHKGWEAEHDQEIVYSEPAGQWYVRADLFWALQAKYRDLPDLAERAAWEAAGTPLPGECEGDLTCTLTYTSLTSGRYLKLYPRGPHAREALKGVEEVLNSVAEDSRSASPVYVVPAASDADFRKVLATLRGQLAPVATRQSARILKQLDAIARGPRRR